MSGEIILRKRLGFLYLWEKPDMEAYKEIVDAKRLLSVMQIPKSLQKGKVEVIVMPLDEEKVRSVRRPAIGLLKNYANPALIVQEKQAWEIHLKDKYGAV